MSNPLLEYQQWPDFTAVQAGHFQPAIDQVLNHYHAVLKRVLADFPSWEATVQPLEEAQNKIERVWNIITHLNSVHSTDAVREAYEAVLPKITDFYSEILQNNKLYQAYDKIFSSTDFKKFSRAQQAVIKHAIRDFKLAGVALPKEKKVRFKAIRTELSKKENQFSKNVLDATLAWQHHVEKSKQACLAGIPKQNLELAAEKAKSLNKTGWVLTLDFPCYYAVVTYCDDRELRKTLYEAYTTRASDQGSHDKKFDNTALMQQILTLRDEEAKLLSYPSFAHYSLVPKMAESPEKVIEFLEDLVSRAKDIAEREFKALKQFANEEGIKKLEAWDIAYYSEKFKQQHFKVSEEALRVYFPVNKVMQGLFDLVHKLYGLNISEVTDAQTWHPDVQLFAVYDAEEQLRGHFYTDLYARDYKRGGAWMADMLPRIRTKTAELQTPVAFLQANLTPAVTGKQAVLTHDEIITLFHEFGHTLHHLLTQVDCLSVSGINGVEWDAVELPSQFMENWCWEWEVVETLTAHVDTGESLPKEEFDKLYATKNYQAAMQLMRQIEFSLFDFRLHLQTAYSENKSVQQVLNEVRAQVSVVPTPEFNRFQHAFTHIFDGGYAAGYYSYKWAEVLSCDAFAAFQETGVLNSETGKRFLTEILEKGGSEEAMQLFERFRGRKPTIDALLVQSGIAA